MEGGTIAKERGFGFRPAPVWPCEERPQKRRVAREKRHIIIDMRERSGEDGCVEKDIGAEGRGGVQG